jgi:phospholipase C
MDRRTFVKGAALGLGAAAIGGAARADFVNLALPSTFVTDPEPSTPLKHIVVLMMENRSLDHYLGWYGAENPLFDARQDASFPSPGGVVATDNWGVHGRGNTHGRGHADPSHGWGGGRLERNGGACDGWLHPDTGNDEFTLSYYDPEDIPVWAQLARGWQTYDRWFTSVLGPTQPNRRYQHSAQSGGRKNNDLPPQLASEHPEWIHGFDWPTIWTVLENGGVSSAYYFSNIPEILEWGDRHIAHARHVSDFYAACAAGTLPAVSFVDPWFIAPEGLSNDDHPHADIRLGQTFISDVVEAFTSSSAYQAGALVVTYDEWGGFWDHVDPPRIADDRATPADPGGEDDFGQLGFRIPTSIVSPWTRGNTVDHTTYDHTSTLRFICDNWGLPYLDLKRLHGTNSIGGAFAGFATHVPEVEFTPYAAPPEVAAAPYTGDTAAATTAVSDLHGLVETGWLDQFPIRTDWRFEDSFLRSRDWVTALARR